MTNLASTQLHLVVPGFSLSRSEKPLAVDALHPESSPG
jgi:hypothetical protein